MEHRIMKHETKALVTFALLLFVITELVVVVTLWGVPNGLLTLGIVTKYILPLLVSLPLVAGVKGYFVIKRRMPSGDIDTLDTLSRQFLTTVIVAYAAIIFMVSAIH